MITNFENITYELTKKEMLILNTVINIFSNIDKPTKSCDIVSLINSQQEIIKLNGVRLRKYTNYIRKNSILPIIATSNGYFVSYNTDIIKKQILSLHERANSIKDCANGIEYFVKLHNNQLKFF